MTGYLKVIVYEMVYNLGIFVGYILGSLERIKLKILKEDV